MNQTSIANYQAWIAREEKLSSDALSGDDKFWWHSQAIGNKILNRDE